MLSRFTSKRARHYALNWFNCLIVCPFRAKSGKYYSRKHGKLMQLGNCNDSNCVGILSDQGEAATASSLSEYTMKYVQSAFTYLQRPPVPTPEFSLYRLDIWGGGGQAKR